MKLHILDRSRRVSCALLFAFAANAANLYGQQSSPAWTRHTIDDSSRGADGTRLADVNGDGLADIVTGWEEGGRIRVYINPGPDKAKQKWPAVTVGEVKSPEDAVFVDLDNDGAVDVVSSCEGKTRTMFVHWAPKDKAKYLDASAWKTEPIPASQNAMMWMYCVPLEIDGKNGIDLVAGGKGKGAKIGWFEPPENPRDLAAWKWHPLRNVGWIMSIVAYDWDRDKDPDILVSDRKGPKRGIFWLENPGPGPAQERPWKERFVGGNDKEIMFLTPGALRVNLIVAAVRGHELVRYGFQWKRDAPWPTTGIALDPVPLPPNTGTAKAVTLADIDRKTAHVENEIVFSCENAKGKSGVMWMAYRETEKGPVWDAHEISGPVGTKYDLVVAIDLDADGDLDVLTCEEAENLGVIWYENPTK